MEMQDRDFLPNRLNFDAIAFCGCTMKEMQIIAICSLIGCMVVLGILTEMFLGMCMIGVGLAFPVTVGVAWFIAIIFQKAKQGKPKGYVKQKFYLLLEDKGIMKSSFIRRSGKWSVGRRIYR